MSSTQNTVVYSGDGAVQLITPGGTQANCTIGLQFNAGTDFTDADAFAIQQAIVAAFPAAWGVVSADIPIHRTDDTTTQYVTDYTSTPPSFT